MALETLRTLPQLKEECKQKGIEVIYSPVADQTFIFNGNDPQINKLTSSWGLWNVIGHNIQFDLSACLKQYGGYPNPVADKDSLIRLKKEVKDMRN